MVYSWPRITLSSNQLPVDLIFESRQGRLPHKPQKSAERNEGHIAEAVEVVAGALAVVSKTALAAIAPRPTGRTIPSFCVSDKKRDAATATAEIRESVGIQWDGGSRTPRRIGIDDQGTHAKPFTAPPGTTGRSRGSRLPDRGSDTEGAGGATHTPAAPPLMIPWLSTLIGARTYMAVPPFAVPPIRAPGPL